MFQIETSVIGHVSIKRPLTNFVKTGRFSGIFQKSRNFLANNPELWLFIYVKSK